MGMIELHPLHEPNEVKEIHTLISRHYQYTESEVARRILDRWDDYRAKFVKIMPTEYRRVLAGQLDMKSDMAKLAAV
jgi:glutamate synthase (NADPH/NADH) large chain